MIVVVVTPSSVIETSLTTVLPDDAPPLPEELSDVSPAELVADDDEVADVAELDEVAAVAWDDVAAMGVETELIDMDFSHEERGGCRTAARLASSTRLWRGAGVLSCV
ncbi:MAG: hypothetical protein E6614_27760 [Bradyrhizobium sp.]|nr:hypothetical protein [Bradyrhizobium sp.]